jgi:hypothetical protein
MNLKEFTKLAIEKRGWTGGRSAKAMYAGLKRRAGDWAIGVNRKEPRQTLRSIEHIGKNRPAAGRRFEALYQAELKGHRASCTPYLDKMKKE